MQPRQIRLDLGRRRHRGRVHLREHPSSSFPRRQEGNDFEHGALTEMEGPVQSGNTKVGSIIRPLNSSLTGFESAV
jgi:hypothetical protein